MIDLAYRLRDTRLVRDNAGGRLRKKDSTVATVGADVQIRDRTFGDSDYGRFETAAMGEITATDIYKSGAVAHIQATRSVTAHIERLSCE